MEKCAETVRLSRRNGTAEGGKVRRNGTALAQKRYGKCAETVRRVKLQA